MVNPDEFPDATDLVRWLAAQGLLAKQYAQAKSDDQRRWLWGGVCQICWPLVYNRVTRSVERERGHKRCSANLSLMEPDCFDRFQDDVEALVDDCLRRADLPIRSLEGWLTMRMPRALIDGYRKRRGARGAPQKPRVPKWLFKALGGERWLVKLATLIAEWGGLPTTAGTGLWPLTAWAEQRRKVTGEGAVAETTIAADIERVLAAMRQNANWYVKNIEVPLGRKQAPVWLPPRTRDDAVAEPEPLYLVPEYERDDALLLALADEAIEVLEHRINRGDDPATAVPDVLRTVFGALPEDLARPPGTGPSGAEWVIVLIDDPDTLARITATALEIIRSRAGR